MKDTDFLFSEFPPISTKEWEDVINTDLKGADYKKRLVWKSNEGFNVNPYYREENINELDFLNTLPNEFPYTRGYDSKSNNWQIRQNFLTGNITERNALAIEAINNGVEAVGLYFGDVKNLGDIKSLLNSIDPTKVYIHILCYNNYNKCLDLFIEFLKSINVEPSSVMGSINIDPVNLALAYKRDLDIEFKNAFEAINKYSDILGGFKFINVGAKILGNAAANLVQELGFGLAWANEYISYFTEKGMDIDKVLNLTTLELSISSNYFMEIAKIRAARTLWSVIAKQYNPKDIENTKTFITSETSTWNKTSYDPYVNMLRSTTETMSAVIGGANAICVNDFSMSYKKDNNFSKRIARNQQTLLKEESYLNKIIDPAAGSYYVENLTNSIMDNAWANFMSVENEGGMRKAIINNFIQDRVEESANRRNLEIASRKIILTGVNQFPNLSEKISDNIEIDIITKEEEGNASYKTIRAYKGADAFEQLRLQTEKAEKQPRVFLLNYGNLNMRKARAGFATNFFGCAGYEIIDNNGFKTAEEGVKAAIEAKADIVVLCSSDEEYTDLVNYSLPILKDKTKVVVAGYPKDMIEEFTKAGVHSFIHVRSKVLELLQEFNSILIK